MYVYFNFYIVLSLSFYIYHRVKNIFKHTFFICTRSRLWWMRLVFNKKALKKNSTLLNYRSHKNQETSAY